MGLIKRLKIIYFEILVFVSGLAIRLLYLSQTPYNLRDHDAYGHLEFIQYIVNNGTLPVYNQGWEFYQQPLYYVIGALIYRLSHLLNVNFYILLQLLSLSLFIGTLVCFYYIIRMFIKPSFLRLLTFSLVVFWPSGIIHSVRVGNDTLQYFTTVIGFLFFLKWVKTKNLNFIYASLIFYVISLLSKSNAIILLPLFFISYHQQLFSIKIDFKQTIKKLFLLFFVTLLSLFILLYNNIFSQQKNFIVANVTNLNGNLRVGNNPVNFIYFDWNKFISHAYISPWDDATGRQYFWNYLFKTSLFGEFGFSRSIHITLAQLLSFTLIVLIVYMLISILITNQKKLKELTYIILFLVLQFIFIIVGRLTLPFASTNDFRYIFPSVISLAILFSSAIKEFKQRKLNLLEYSGYFIIISFITYSILFFIFHLD